jgi:hypothetical protein
MLSSTTNLTICDIDPNADGQEFAVSRVQRRECRRPAPGAAQPHEGAARQQLRVSGMRACS